MCSEAAWSHLENNSEKLFAQVYCGAAVMHENEGVNIKIKKNSELPLVYFMHTN